MRLPEFLQEYGHLDPQRIADHLGSRAERIDVTTLTLPPVVRSFLSENNIPPFWQIILFGEISRRFTTIDIYPEEYRTRYDVSISIHVGQEPHIFTYLPTPQTQTTENLYDAQHHADFSLGLVVTGVSYETIRHESGRVLNTVRFERDLGYYEYLLSVDQFGRVSSSLSSNPKVPKDST